MAHGNGGGMFVLPLHTSMFTALRAQTKSTDFQLLQVNEIDRAFFLSL